MMLNVNHAWCLRTTQQAMSGNTIGDGLQHNGRKEKNVFFSIT
ncbi:hypothetical protein [Prevotella histicola]|nr:hypothetical protein [Prevotella histicola]